MHRHRVGLGSDGVWPGPSDEWLGLAASAFFLRFFAARKVWISLWELYGICPAPKRLFYPGS